MVVGCNVLPPVAEVGHGGLLFLGLLYQIVSQPDLYIVISPIPSGSLRVRRYFVLSYCPGKSLDTVKTELLMGTPDTAGRVAGPAVLEGEEQPR